MDRRLHEHTLGALGQPVAAPSDEACGEAFNCLRQTDRPPSVGHFSVLHAGYAEIPWRNAPLGPVIRDSRAMNLTVLRTSYRNFYIVDLRPESLGIETVHARHDSFIAT